MINQAFDGIATAKANAEKNLQNARAIFESHLDAVFSQRGEEWAEKSLDQIWVTQTGSTPRTGDRDNYGDFIPFVKPADFNKDGSIDYNKDGLSQLGYAGARKVPAGSVLMVCIGATIGKCGYSIREVTTNQQINAITPSHGFYYKFLYYQMLTRRFQGSVMENSAQATLPIINKSKWSSLVMAFPRSIGEQQQIAETLDEISVETQTLEALYQKKITALDDLKKSLLDQAFTGNL